MKKTGFFHKIFKILQFFKILFFLEKNKNFEKNKIIKIL